MPKLLTCSKAVIPPVRPAQISFQVVCSSSDYHHRRRDEGANAQEHAEYHHDDAQPLQQAAVRYFHRFRRLHSEYHGYPVNRPNARVSLKRIISEILGLSEKNVRYSRRAGLLFAVKVNTVEYGKRLSFDEHGEP